MPDGLGPLSADILASRLVRVDAPADSIDQ
jgi:hypothetical protein